MVVSAAAWNGDGLWQRREWLFFKKNYARPCDSLSLWLQFALLYTHRHLTMQYDRVHEYLEARGHTRESYVEAFCDKVRVVKMGCTYKEWCLSEDARAEEWGKCTPMPAWDLKKAQLQPVRDEMEREHTRGRMFCQIVACFDAGDGSYFEILPESEQGETVQSEVICVPLLTDYKEYTVKAYSPFVYIYGTGIPHHRKGHPPQWEYLYRSPGPDGGVVCGNRWSYPQHQRVLLTSALFDKFSPQSNYPCAVQQDTRLISMTSIRNGLPEVAGDPNITKGWRRTLWHLADVWLPERKTIRRIPPLTEPGFSDALIGVLAVGRWWHITTLQARPYHGAMAVAKVFGDPFWSLTLCDRLQRDVHYDVNDLNQRFDAIQNAHTVAINNLRHDFETASKTVESDDVNRHIDARAAEVAPYTAILKTQVEVMHHLCGYLKDPHKCTYLGEEWQRLETMETLLQTSLAQLDTMDTDFQDDVDEKISTAQAEYTDELDVRIDAVRAEYTTEIAELREALERQQTQQCEASALRETLESDTLQVSHNADLTKFRQDIESAADARIDAVRAEYITEAKFLAQTCEVADAIRAEYTTEIAVLREALERQQAQHRQAIAQLVRKLDQR